MYFIPAEASYAGRRDVSVADLDGFEFIDHLYDIPVSEAAPKSVVTISAGLQFPVFATFLKLTLLNHCRRNPVPAGTDDAGRPTFRAV